MKLSFTSAGTKPTPQWLLAVYKKVFVLTPLSTLSCVFLIILQRLLRLLSFILPLKIILIASGGRLPGFLAELFGRFELIHVVVGLSLFAIFCNFSAIKLASIVDAYVAGSADKIRAKNKKTSAYIDIPAQLKNTYSQVVRSVSAILFALIVSSFGLYINSGVFIVFGACFVAFWFLLLLSSTYKIPLDVEYFKREHQTIQRWWQFFTNTIVFVVVLFQVFLLREYGGAVLLFVAFLLARYAIAAANEFVTSYFKISESRSVINSLLFYNAVELEASKPKSFRSDITVAKIEEIAHELLNQRFGEHRILWIELSKANVYGVVCVDLHVAFYDDACDEKISTFLLKIFNHKRRAQFEHELTIISRADNRLPVPKLLQYAKLDYFGCALYGGSFPLSQTEMEAEDAFVNLLIQMWSVPVSDKVLDAYIRTHKSDVARLRVCSVELLFLHSSDQDIKKSVLFFIENFDDIMNKILHMPLALHNSELSQKTVAVDASSSKVICCHWGAWSAQPIGCALSNLGTLFSEQQLDNIVAAVRLARGDCEDIRRVDLQFVAEFHTLLRGVEAYNYEVAINALVNVVALFNEMQAVDLAELTSYVPEMRS